MITTDGRILSDLARNDDGAGAGKRAGRGRRLRGRRYRHRLPTENHPFGLAISAFSRWDLASGVNTGGNINVPVTIPVNSKFKINLNGGWLYDNVAKISYATWGAGFEWGFVDKFALIGEVFGQAGALPAVNPGDPPPSNSIVEPRTQIGVRFTPQDNIDIDVIWGHNITGENAQWGTLGINLRF